MLGAGDTGLAKFKGSVFESTRMFTVEAFGADAVARVLAELDAEDQRVLSDVQLLGWYPVEPVLRYMRVLDRLYGKNDLKLCEQSGRFSAGWQMNTVLKVFLRFRSPVLTTRDTLAWFKSQPQERQDKPRAGLSPEREAELLSLWAKARTTQEQPTVAPQGG